MWGCSRGCDNHYWEESLVTEDRVRIGPPKKQFSEDEGSAGQQAGHGARQGQVEDQLLGQVVRGAGTSSL